MISDLGANALFPAAQVPGWQMVDEAGDGASRVIVMAVATRNAFGPLRKERMLAIQEQSILVVKGEGNSDGFHFAEFRVRPFEYNSSHE